MTEPDSDFYQHYLKYELEQSSNLVAYHKINGDYIWVSPNFKKYAGYDPAEMIGKNPYGFVHIQDRKRIKLEHHIPLLLRLSISKMNYRFRNKSGDYVWVRTTSIPVKVDGKLEKFITITRAVDKTREFENKLEIQSNINREMSNLANIGYWEYDFINDKNYWSEKVYEIHGLLPDEDINLEKALSYYDPKAIPVLQKAIEKAVNKGIPYNLKLPFKGENRKKTWVQTIGAPLFKDDKCIKIYGVFQDITAYEENHTKKLNNFVQFLSNQNRRLREFTQIVSHDFRGPLTNLNMIAEEFANPENSLDTTYLKELMKQNSNTLLRKIEVLSKSLDHTMNQQDEANGEQVNIRLSTEKIVQDLSVFLDQYKIEIKNKFDWKTIRYPAFVLQSILYNLIKNSIFYSDPLKEKKWIKIKTFKRDKIHYLTIKDNGLGIPKTLGKEYRFKMGEIFHKDKSGHGMGLFQVQTQVESNNGQLEVVSKKDKGTTIRIALDKFKNIPAYE